MNAFVKCPFCAGHETISAEAADELASLIAERLEEFGKGSLSLVTELANIHNAILNRQERAVSDYLVGVDTGTMSATEANLRAADIDPLPLRLLQPRGMVEGMMSYQNLTDAELIKYALIDAAPGSLTYLLATAYEDNGTHVAELEKSQQEIIYDLERSQAEELSQLHETIDDQAKRIAALENIIDAAEDEAVEKAIHHEMEEGTDPLLE